MSNRFYRLSWRDDFAEREKDNILFHVYGVQVYPGNKIFCVRGVLFMLEPAKECLEYLFDNAEILDFINSKINEIRDIIEEYGSDMDDGNPAFDKINSILKNHGVTFYGAENNIKTP